MSKTPKPGEMYECACGHMNCGCAAPPPSPDETAGIGKADRSTSIFAPPAQPDETVIRQKLQGHGFSGQELEDTMALWAKQIAISAQPDETAAILRAVIAEMRERCSSPPLIARSEATEWADRLDQLSVALLARKD